MHIILNVFYRKDLTHLVCKGSIATPIRQLSKSLKSPLLNITLAFAYNPNL